MKKRYPTRGFASMDKERQKEIASRGGKARAAKGVGHQWTADSARKAALLGVEIRRRKYGLLRDV